MILLSSQSSKSPQVLPPPPGWFPSVTVSGQLFVTGATIGPIIDGIHNQCLLQYKVAPIILDVPNWLPSIGENDDSLTANSYFESHLFASSWFVPPLLGIAYIVLGGILPHIIQNIITMIRENLASTSATTTTATTGTFTMRNIDKPPTTLMLLFKAILAVLSTAMIILFSQYLILHPNESNYGIIDNTAVFESSDKLEQHLLILMTAAITQWAYLDGTLVAFLTACITSVFGPLSELPFIAHHIWEYLPEAGDIYLPLQSIESTSIPGQFLHGALGDDFNSLALNGVTGPCYFAVTMDAIAIGRYFTSIEVSNICSGSRNRNEVIENIPENRLFIASSREQQPTTTIPNEENEVLGVDIKEESRSRTAARIRDDASK